MGLLDVILPKRRQNERGVANTATFQPTSSGQVLTAPRYLDHLDDLFTNRTIQDSKTLITNLIRFDSDVSAAVNAYLTVANTELNFLVYDSEQNLDREGIKTVHSLMETLTTQFDYTLGFTLKPSLRALCENLRYMILARGGCCAELVFDKLLLPRELRMVDLGTIRWFEKASGLYKPVQQARSGDDINLDIPNFFVSFYRRDPTSIYTYSPFVSAINTIAARQQVVNDLYRIMQRTGYPRIDITVMEEILRKNAPANLQGEDGIRKWINERISEINTTISNLRADSAFVHTDSMTATILNKDGPSKSLDVTAIISVLNASNQAALKTMATFIGRGEQGVNTGTVEARVFSLNAQELNHPVAELLSNALTLALRLQGSESRVEVKFAPVELRPDTELEPMRVTKQARLLEQLSRGLITDDEFHLWMNGRPRPDSSPELSGTEFLTPQVGVDTGSISPNSDPLGRSITPDGSDSSKSNEMKNSSDEVWAAVFDKFLNGSE